MATRIGLLALVSCLYVAAFARASDAPAELKVGDTAAVARDDVKLMTGSTAVLQLKKGMKFQVTAVKGDWVGGSVIADGKQHNGWVRRAELAADVAGWRIKVLYAVRTNRYTDGQWKYEPKDAVAVIALEFEALTAQAGTQAEQLQSARKLFPEDLHKALQYVPKETASKPSRLFLSTDVELALEGGAAVKPGFTSSLQGSGATAGGGRMEVSAMAGDDLACLNYLRIEGCTVGLMQPGKTSKVTLAFPVPHTARGGTLKFPDAPPVAVTFKPD